MPINEEVLQMVRQALSGGGSQDDLSGNLENLPPFDLAEMLPRFDERDQLSILSHLPHGVAAETLEHLEPPHQYRLLHHLEGDRARQILNEMPGDSVTDLFLAVHPRQAETLLDWLPEGYQAKIRGLMTYPENTAGGLATVNYVAARQSWTAEEALTHLRKVGREAELVAYVYVLDPLGRLVGVTSLRDLILAPPKAVLAEIMNTNNISVPTDMDQEEVARVVSRYDLVALPVVNADGRMIGIITVDDVLDVIEEEATEDIQRFGGQQPLTVPYLKTGVLGIFLRRAPWLLVLFLAANFTGTVLRHFEETLSQVVSLAIFIPLLIGTGGNTGSQTVTTLVRAMAIGEVGFADLLRVVGRETLVGMLLGTMMGTATLLSAFALGVDPAIGRAVAVAAAFIVIWAAMVAAVLPLVLNRFRVDPAVVSGPFIATVVDGTGLFIYFSIARLLLGLG